MKKLLTNKKLMSMLSLVLVVTMMITNINLGGVRAKAETILPEVKAGQVAKAATSEFVGYYALDAEGKITGSNLGKNVENSKVEQDGIKAWKTITPVAGNPTAYDVSLKVETSQTVQTNDTAVALVFDTSNSMIWNMDGSKKENVSDKDQRITAAKNATINFVNKLAEDADGKVFVSLIKFSSNAEKKTDWIDIKTAEGKQTVIDAINSLENDGGTKTDAGLRLAYNRLNMDSVKNCANKYTVLITDGKPTYDINFDGDYYEITDNTDEVTSSAWYYDDFWGEWIKYYGDTGNDKCEKDECDSAITEARKISSIGAELYSIYIGNKDEECYESYVYTRKNSAINVDKSVYNRVKNIYGDDAVYTTGRINKKYYSYYEESKAKYKVEDLLKDLSPNKYYAASDVASFNTSIQEVLKCVTEGANGNGWAVTDPMANFITLNTTFTDDERVSVSGETAKTITWNLDPEDETPGRVTKTSGTRPGETIYTYTISYRINLNTDTLGFVDNANYATNGVTTLSYKNGEETMTLDFNVPVLKGTAPEYFYTVSYYQKDKTTGNYVEFKRENKQAKIHTSISVADDDRINNCPDYYDANTSESKLTGTVGTTEEANHLKVKYDPKTTGVKVVYHLITLDSNNNESTTPVSDYITDEVVYVNDPYTLSPAAIYTSGADSYSYVPGHEGETLSIAHLAVSKDSNVLNVYYKRDLRAAASVSQTKHFKWNKWVLKNDKYEQDVEENSGNPSPLVENVKHFDNYTIPTYSAENGYSVEKITFNGSDVTSGSEKSLNAGVNMIDVYYVKNDVEPKVDLTVVHNYQYTKHYIDENGMLQTKVVTDKAIDGNTYKQTYRVGETYTVAARTNNNDGLAYTLKNNSALTGTVSADNNTIVLNYEVADVWDEESTLTVVHVFERHFEEIYTATRAAVDENGNVMTDEEGNVIVEVVGTATRPAVEVVTDLGDTDSYPAEGSKLYKNQLVSVDVKNVEGYYLVGEEPSNVRANDQTITLTYVKNDITSDVREKAKVSVKHNYYVKKLDIVDGVLVEGGYVLEANPAADEYNEERIGSTFTAEAETTFNGKEYSAGSENVYSKIVLDGTNTIVLNYYRDGGDEDLTKVSLSAVNHFRTWNMGVKNGLAGFYNDGITELSTGSAVVSPAGTYYVGMKITIEDASTDVYNEKNDSSDMFDVTLSNAVTSLNYYYDHKVELPKQTITADVYFETETIAVNGTHTSTSGISVENAKLKDVYVGSFVSLGIDWTDEKLADYSLTDENITITVSPAAVALAQPLLMATSDGVVNTDVWTGFVPADGLNVEFHIYKVVDNSEPATLSVVNHVTTIDWNKEIVSVVTDGSIGAKYFRTIPVNVVVSRAGCTFDRIEVNPDGILDSQNEDYATVVLESGENTVDVYFTKIIDSREKSEVVLKHIYKTTDTYTNSVTEDVVEEVKNTFDDGIWVGNEYKVDEKDYKLTNGGYTFTFKSVSPESITVAPVFTNEGLRIDGEAPNVVEITYERSFSSQVITPYYPPYVPNDPDPVIETGDDETPQGSAVDETPGIIIDDEGDETPQGSIPETQQDIELEDDGQALGDALVKTGTVPVAVYYGFGAALMLAAMYLAFRKKREEA